MPSENQCGAYLWYSLYSLHIDNRGIRRAWIERAKYGIMISWKYWSDTNSQCQTPNVLDLCFLERVNVSSHNSQCSTAICILHIKAQAMDLCYYTIIHELILKGCNSDVPNGPALSDQKVGTEWRREKKGWFAYLWNQDVHIHPCKFSWLKLEIMQTPICKSIIRNLKSVTAYNLGRTCLPHWMTWPWPSAACSLD